MATTTNVKVKTKDKQKEKKKGRKKSTEISPNVTTIGDAKNEGENVDWAYKPPDGMVALDMSEVDEEFDWDAFEGDKNKELWIIRIPEELKAKQLDGLEIPVPTTAPGSKLSILELKRAKYEVWSAELKGSIVQDKPGQPPLGEEISTLTCLLPRTKKKGRLYIAPRPISQHIVITQAAVVPSVHAAAATSLPVRESVPNELLKHQFLPYGVLSTETNVSNIIDMDVAGITSKSKATQEEVSKKDSPEKFSKKRKVVDSSSKKSKKLKL